MTYRQLMVIIATTFFCVMSIDAYAARIPTRMIENAFKGAGKASREYNWGPAAYGTTRTLQYRNKNDSLHIDSLMRRNGIYGKIYYPQNNQMYRGYLSESQEDLYLKDFSTYEDMDSYARRYRQRMPYRSSLKSFNMYQINEPNENVENQGWKNYNVGFLPKIVEIYHVDFFGIDYLAGQKNDASRVGLNHVNMVRTNAGKTLDVVNGNDQEPEPETFRIEYMIMIAGIILFCAIIIEVKKRKKTIVKK